jgi:hypothetical protein
MNPLSNRGFSLKVAALFVATITYLSYLNWSSLAAHIFPAGDFAADMLLTNRISDEGYLLVGHYSRWGFNHPGPFWFYYNWLTELLLGWLPLDRWQIWQIGNVFINAVAIAFSSITLSKYLLERFDLGFSLLVSALLIGFVGYEISNLWMPNRLVAPYPEYFTEK